MERQPAWARAIRYLAIPARLGGRLVRGLRTRHLLLVMAGVLTVIPGLLFVEVLAASGGPPKALAQHLNVEPARSGLPLEACEGGRAELVLVLKDLDRHTDTLTAGAYMCVPFDLLRGLGSGYDRSGRLRSVIEQRTDNAPGRPPSRPRLARRFANLQVGLAYSSELPSHTGPDIPVVRVRVPLAALLAEQPGPLVVPTAGLVHAGDIALPVDGTPARYPFDWYASVGDFEVEVLSDHVVVRRPYEGGVLETSGENPAFPLEVKVLAQSTLSPFAAGASVMAQSPPADRGESQRVALRLGRAARTREFVVVVAVIPLILAILLSLMLFSGAMTIRVPADAIVGVASVLLAVLPIRFVLVPSEVTELTLVDYWLGWMIGLLAAIGCYATYRAAKARQEVQATDEGDTRAAPGTGRERA